jgi:BirA family biotin operon repressor/biotin-[acetyl-CoA-carboxylase] ligase
VRKTTINSQEIRDNLHTNWLGQRIFTYPAVRSTNDLLKEMAQKGEPAGTLLLADYQSQGKGRRGRRWQAPAGSSLLLSLLFRPEWPIEQANWLSMMAGLAVVRAVGGETSLATALKWPNDIVITRDGQTRKLGGILLESETLQHRLRWVVLGIGLNVNISADQLPQASTPATSLLIELGQSIPRQQLLLRLLHELDRLYSSIDDGNSPQPAWNNLLVNIGKPVRVSEAGRQSPIAGMAEGTDSWGRLLVRDNEGNLVTISAGDVTLRG